MDGLTTKQQKFVDAYQGNATEAALFAGYSKKTAPFIGAENLKKPQVLAAIKARQEKEAAPIIASRQDRQKFWSLTMSDKNADMKDRLKASELLGKSEADFTDNLNVRASLDEKLRAMDDEEIEKRLSALEDAALLVAVTAGSGGGGG